MLSPRPTLGCTHDSVTASGNHHEILRDHFPREILRHFELRRIGRSASRPKDGDLAQVLKRRKHLRCVAHLFYRSVDQLEVGYAHPVARDF